jgi:large subunit ribosomal protein L28
MSSKCELCGKTVLFGHNVSHANNKTRKISFSNIQKVRTLVAGRVKRVNVCTTCIKGGKITKPFKRPTLVVATA